MRARSGRDRFEEETGLHTPKAYVVLRESHRATAEFARELQEFVRQRITPYKYPRRIEFLAELPKTGAGKILRYRLRESSRGISISQGSHSLSAVRYRLEDRITILTIDNPW